MYSVLQITELKNYVKEIPKMIKIEHLVKNYGSNCAVDDISIEIQRG